MLARWERGCALCQVVKEGLAGVEMCAQRPQDMPKPSKSRGSEGPWGLEVG